MVEVLSSSLSGSTIVEERKQGKSYDEVQEAVAWSKSYALRGITRMTHKRWCACLPSTNRVDSISIIRTMKLFKNGLDTNDPEQMFLFKEHLKSGLPGCFVIVVLIIIAVVALNW